MQLEKSYRLINFMNRSHHRGLLEIIGSLGWMGCMLATGSRALSSSLRSEFVDGDIKIAFRRAGWISKTSWLKSTIVSDPFFFFTEGLNEEGLKDVEEYLEKRKENLSQGDYLSDMLYVQAAALHLAIENKRDEQEIKALEDDFYRYADQLLEQVEMATPGRSNSRKAGQEREGDFSLNDARVALTSLQKILPIDVYPWYVISGTFLGLHRENGFLQHDYDIDVGINIEDVNVYDMIEKLKSTADFAVKKVDHHLEVERGDGQLSVLRKRIALVKLVHASGINVDIFIHYLEDGVIWHGSSIHRWENTPYELEKRELDGMAVLAPKQADLYLTENYGEWRVPVKSFDCTLSTPNLSITRNFLSIALFIKRLYIFSKSQPLDAQKLKHRLIENHVIREAKGRLYTSRYI